MKTIILRKKKPIFNLDLKNFSSINHISKSLKNISQIKLLMNRREIKLGEIFSIEILKNKNVDDDIKIFGCNESCYNLGKNWQKDKVFVYSDLGSNIGSKMISGEIKVNGSVHDFLGAEMSGGLIYITGNAGNKAGGPYLGKKTGMTGGEIVIEGNAGDFIGLLMRRGLIIVKGSTGDFCCLKMIAGNVILFKEPRNNFGISMKRGSLILLKKKKLVIKDYFKKSGSIESSYLNFLKKYLKEKFFINLNNMKFIRYYGDRNLDGIGEVLVNDN